MRRLSQTGMRLAATVAAFWPGPAVHAADLSTDRLDSPVRGIIRSRHEATISTELQARVISLPFREGQPFKKGDVLVAFQCDRQRAELAAAMAEYRGLVSSRDNSRKLRSMQAAGSYDVELAEAQADKAEASVSVARARIADCEMKAPFSGRISELKVHEFDIPRAGELMRIVDDKKLEVELIAPSNWLRWLKAGATFSLSVDETGSTLRATVADISAEVDAVSQTIKIRGVLDPTGIDGVLPGMTGSATFDKATQ